MTKPVLAAWVRHVGLVAASILLTASSPALAQSRSQDPQVIERPEWSVGDWWEFESNRGAQWRLTVVDKRSDGYALAETKVGNAPGIEARANPWITDLDGWPAARAAASGSARMAADGSWGGDRRMWLQFPLKIGARWFFSVMSTSTDSQGRERGRFMYDYDCHAKEWETIEVGGRWLRAIKIAISQRRREQGSRDSPLTAWYAPEAKRLVRLTPTYVGGPNVNVTAFSVGGPSTVVASVPTAPSPIAAPSSAESGSRQAPQRVVDEERQRAEQQRLADEQRKRAEEQRLADEQRKRETAAPRPAVPPPVVSSPPPPPADTKPPVIALNYPAADLKVEGDQIVVVGLVTDDTAVARVQLTVNGTEIERAAEVKAGARGVPVRATVKLAPGDNVIEVTATDAAGNVAQIVRTVSRVGPVRAATTSQSFAVVIGVGQYDNTAIPKLPYAVRDAEAMYQVLIGPAGFKKENVSLLTDRAGQKPTLRNIKSALGTFLARSAQQGDTVLIFFAGHGAPEVDARGLERDGLAKYLIPSDADPNDLYATALSMDEIQTVFGRIDAERMIMFVDACYSGAAGGRTFASNRLSTRGVAIDDQFLDRLTRAKGRAIITASRPSEVSVELAEFGHGLFTYYLVEGLKGAADLNHDGVVTLQELYEYVEGQVSRKSRAVGANQHPVMKGELEGPLPIVRLK